jgi:hypothetical protein
MNARNSSVAELEACSNFTEVLDAYSDECSIIGMPTPKAKMPAYRAFEAAGALKVSASIENNRIIGLIPVLTPPMAHYDGIIVAVTESFFVLPERRSSGPGIRLLRMAEEYAQSIGSPGLLVSAPCGGALAAVMAKTDYAKTSEVFFKSFSKAVIKSDEPILLPSMSDSHIERVAEMQTAVLKMEQIDFNTRHVLHSGVYSRTITMPPNTIIVGALIKIPTTVTVSGDVVVFTGEKSTRLEGYSVLSAQANRKQVFVAIKETHITMSFATNAKTVEEAEAEFTDEAEMLASRREGVFNKLIMDEV